MRKLRFQNMFALGLLLSLCACESPLNVVVPDTVTCTAAGSFLSGAICAHSLSSETHELTFDEFVSFLEPKAADEAQGIPERSGALCQSSDDWTKNKTALEQACRLLGKQCSFALKKMISSMTTIQTLSIKHKGTLTNENATKLRNGFYWATLYFRGQ